MTYLLLSSALSLQASCLSLRELLRPLCTQNTKFLLQTTWCLLSNSHHIPPYLCDWMEGKPFCTSKLVTGPTSTCGTNITRYESDGCLAEGHHSIALGSMDCCHLTVAWSWILRGAGSPDLRRSFYKTLANVSKQTQWPHSICRNSYKSYYLALFLKSILQSILISIVKCQNSEQIITSSFWLSALLKIYL